MRLKKQDGASEDTLATRAFSTGDKFQLGLKVNRPSYVYIFNEDPNGRITMLHPRPGRTAAVDAMGTVFLPAQGAFQFEGPAGLEKLLVLMSEDEVFQPDATLQKIKPDLVTRAVYPASANRAPTVTPSATMKVAAATACHRRLLHLHPRPSFLPMTRSPQRANKWPAMSSSHKLWRTRNRSYSRSSWHTTEPEGTLPVYVPSAH